MTSSLLAESYRPTSGCIGRVATVMTELLLCIGRVCHSYDSNRFCHINAVLLIVNNSLYCKTGDSRFPIVNFPFLKSNISLAPASIVYPFERCARNSFKTLVTGGRYVPANCCHGVIAGLNLCQL